MLFQRFVSEGLAHYSYIIGEGRQAVVIDPRRDCDVYIEAATQEALAITHILGNGPASRTWVWRSTLFCQSSQRGVFAQLYLLSQSFSLPGLGAVSSFQG